MSTTPVMRELVQSLRLAPPENLDKLLSEHEGDGGHCPRCHTVSPCTLWSATMAARYPRPRQGEHL